MADDPTAEIAIGLAKSIAVNLSEDGQPMAATAISSLIDQLATVTAERDRLRVMAEVRVDQAGGEGMIEAIDQLRDEYRKHARYVVEAKDEVSKAYWRTYAAGILHALNKLERVSHDNGESEDFSNGIPM